MDYRSTGWAEMLGVFPKKFKKNQFSWFFLLTGLVGMDKVYIIQDRLDRSSVIIRHLGMNEGM